MALFKKKQDPMSLTMALVQAYAEDNQVMVDQARQGLSGVGTKEMLLSLYQFGQILNRANLGAEQTAVIEAELSAEGRTPEMTAAIQGVGRAVLLDRTHTAFIDAINTYVPTLQGSTSDQPRQMALALSAITGAICRRLKVGFNWK